MSDLTKFLLARVAEDDAVAREASPGPWSLDSDDYPEAIYDASGYETVVSGGRWGGEARIFNSDADAHHIARCDPARVLVECKAKRRIMEECADLASSEDVYTHADLILHALALPYAHHPDCREEWQV